MDRIPASNSNSRNIISYGWQPAPMILEVEFSGSKHRPNTVYQYPGVPQDLWRGLMEAPSAGNYLTSTIKPNYPAVKVA